MKRIQELTIAPEKTWRAVGDDNPLRAIVKLGDGKSTVETIIPHDMMEPLLDMVSGIVAQAAERNIAEFVAEVSAIEADKPQQIEVTQ
jgi:hypothetical protein